MIISAACRAIVNGKENVFKVHRHSDFFPLDETTSL